MDDRPSLDAAIRVAAAPARVMARVVEQTLTLIPSAEGSAVELLDGGEMVYTCCAGSLTGTTGLRLGLRGSLSGLSVRRGETLRCDDASLDERVDRAACARVGAISMICVPLRHDHRPVGVLKVVAPTAHAFDDEDVAVLHALARFITVAITTSEAMIEVIDELVEGGGPGADASGTRARTSTFVANVLHPGLAADASSVEQVREVIDHHRHHPLYQPVVDLGTGSLAGVEALTRVEVRPERPPDAWVAQAHRVGLGDELELAFAAGALEGIDQLPGGCYIAVNLGPEAIVDPACLEVLSKIEPGRLVVELTEHVEVEDYPLLRHLLRALRRSGARLAVDDTGSGFASLSHIIKLAPDLIKLDMELVRGIDVDPVRRSLATALATFAADTGAEVTAEGIETEAELSVVRTLGIRYAQGFLLARPCTAEMVPAATRQWSEPARLIA